MHDPRIDQLARQLVRHSIALKRGERVLLDLFEVPEAVGLALIRAARARGAEPFVQLHSSRLLRELWRGATESQYRTLAKHRLAFARLAPGPCRRLRGFRSENRQQTRSNASDLPTRTARSTRAPNRGK